MKQFKFLFWGLMAVLFVTACQSSTNTTTSSQSKNTESVSSETIIIQDSKFVPSELSVQTGTKVIWINQDKVKHKIVFNGYGDGVPLMPGQSWTNEFMEPGDYEVTCSLHSEMKGKVLVK